MLRQLPSKTEVAALLVDISQVGVASGLEFELFKPEPEIPVEFYAELPIKIRVNGNFHQFGTFVSGVAALPRIVTLHDFVISQVKDAGKGKSRDDAAHGWAPVRGNSRFRRIITEDGDVFHRQRAPAP